MGAVPVKNYTTNIFPEINKFTGEYLRTHFTMKPAPCWACAIAHCRMMEVTEGPYKGFVGEEPEYEGMAAMGPVIGQTDPGAADNACEPRRPVGLRYQRIGVSHRLDHGMLRERDHLRKATSTAWR